MTRFWFYQVLKEYVSGLCIYLIWINFLFCFVIRLKPIFSDVLVTPKNDSHLKISKNDSKIKILLCYSKSPTSDSSLKSMFVKYSGKNLYGKQKSVNLIILILKCFTINFENCFYASRIIVSDLVIQRDVCYAAVSSIFWFYFELIIKNVCKLFFSFIKL